MNYQKFICAFTFYNQLDSFRFKIWQDDVEIWYWDYLSFWRYIRLIISGFSVWSIRLHEKKIGFCNQENQVCTRAFAEIQRIFIQKFCRKKGDILSLKSKKMRSWFL
jgi:hypothetical protein